MSLEFALLGLMPTTVSVRSFSHRSTDGYGRPVYSTISRSYAAHVTENLLLIRKTAGQSTQVKAIAWVATTRAISPQDQFSYLGSTARIIQAERYFDERDVHHVKVYLG